jgi:hypothetical protein
MSNPPVTQQLVDKAIELSDTVATIGGHSISWASAIIALFTVVFAIMLYRAQKAQRLDWVDMLTRDGTKVSTTKVLQLIGGFTATFVVIHLTLSEKLSWDMLAIYLSYVASIDGYAKFIMAKYGVSGSDDSKVPFKKNTSE